VVGDDAQSIYSFRAATVRNILDFPGHFTPPARIVTLEQNYRSTQPILAASNAVIALAAERFTKNLWSAREASARPWLTAVRDEADQARYVVARVLENREAGLPLKAQAVLFRTSHHSDTLEFELTRRNIPFVKFGGLKFLEAAHVKDMLAALRFAENPRDRVAGFRVTQLVPGIGPASAARILDRLAAPDPAAMLITYAPPRAGDEWRSFAALFDGLFRRASGWPAEFEQVRRWYEPHLERIHDDAPARAADLAQLEQIAASYPTRQQFLTDLTLDPPSATSDEAGAPLLDEDYLILSTIHSAKGQEWKSVFVLNAVDGCIPSDLATGSADEIEEERRLLYVALTRAKDQLDVIVPQRFYSHSQAARGDRYVHALRTRFIPTPVARHFEHRTWPSAQPGAAAAKPSPPIDVTARMRAMWR
jgi:DNA helicase-2/ATP-dependent DNA helicase PcrA